MKRAAYEAIRIFRRACAQAIAGALLLGACGAPQGPAPRAVPLISGGSLEILSASYTPDPNAPTASNQVEGDNKPPVNGRIFQPLQRLYEEHKEFGALRIAVRNRSTTPLRIAGIDLNGGPVASHDVDFPDGVRDDRGVVWYRARPRRLEPGDCGEVYICFRRRPAGRSAVVGVRLGGGQTVSVEVPYTEPPLSVDFVTADNTGRTLYVYGRRGPFAGIGRLAGVALDGVPLRDVSVYGESFPGGVALAVARLPRPLTVGDFHLVGLTTTTGRTVAALFRVLPFASDESVVGPRPSPDVHRDRSRWAPDSSVRQSLFNLHFSPG